MKTLPHPSPFAMRSTLAAAALAALAPSAAAAQLHAVPVLGLAEWTPMLLLLAGFLLLAVEVFVVPGFGWSGILGLLAMLGAVLLVLAPGPLGAALALGLLVSSLTLLGIAVWGVASRLRAGHPLLGGMLGRDEGYVAALPRPELEGLDGVAVTDLRPAGTARIGDEQIDVVSDAGWIAAGTPVRVLHAEGYRHVVRAAGTLDPPADGPPDDAA